MTIPRSGPEEVGFHPSISIPIDRSGATEVGDASAAHTRARPLPFFSSWETRAKPERERLVTCDSEPEKLVYL